MTVRETYGSEVSSRMIPPTTAPATPAASAAVDSRVGKITPSGEGPLAPMASLARRMPSARPIG
jgi:hypothetical protein